MCCEFVQSFTRLGLIFARTCGDGLANKGETTPHHGIFRCCLFRFVSQWIGQNGVQDPRFG